MTTPIPQGQIADPKDAVLWACLHKMETIDENAGTRVAFASSILYNAQFGMNQPIFTNELEQIRGILKIEAPKEEVAQASESTVRQDADADAETTMRDI